MTIVNYVLLCPYTGTNIGWTPATTDVVAAVDKYFAILRRFWKILLCFSCETMERFPHLTVRPWKVFTCNYLLSIPLPLSSIITFCRTPCHWGILSGQRHTNGEITTIIE